MSRQEKIRLIKKIMQMKKIVDIEDPEKHGDIFDNLYAQSCDVLESTYEDLKSKEDKL